MSSPSANLLPSGRCRRHARAVLPDHAALTLGFVLGLLASSWALQMAPTPSASSEGVVLHPGPRDKLPRARVLNAVGAYRVLLFAGAKRW